MEGEMIKKRNIRQIRKEMSEAFANARKVVRCNNKRKMDGVAMVRARGYVKAAYNRKVV